MKRLAAYIIPVLILIIFILIMVSGYFLKQSLTNTDNFKKYLQIVEQNIMADNWERAEANYSDLKRAWDQILPRIQFSVERDELNRIEINLARLQVFIKMENKSIGLAELREAEEHWNRLGKL